MTDLSLKLAFRNTVAVMAGLLAIVALSTIADGALQSKGIFPAAGQPLPVSLMLIALLYRLLFNAAGGWVTARLALEPRMRSVWILTGIVFASTWVSPASAATDARVMVMGQRWPVSTCAAM